ncbi:hypothetical protein [Streptomyces sp. NPDC026673]|uniref:hypothetical protein n=1 Tax=Streptomyces sp. NPDC026673 TaxID=3155724 RepID=UPI0033DA2A1B
MSNNTTIQDRYATRLAEDLESNANEQEKLRAHLAELQAHLARLEQEREWLTRLRGTVTSATGAGGHEDPADEAPATDGAGEAAPETTMETTAEPEAETDAGAEEPRAVPRPRGRKPAAPPRARKPAKKAAASRRGREAKPAAPPAARGEEPTLRSLVADVLGAVAEPRMVSEFVDAVAKRFPDRATPSAPVMRNALESLVAKGLAERERKQGSVFYTPVAPPAGATAGEAAEPRSEPETATA